MCQMLFFWKIYEQKRLQRKRENMLKKINEIVDNQD